jgi:hypothetical protein
MPWILMPGTRCIHSQCIGFLCVGTRYIGSRCPGTQCIVSCVAGSRWVSLITVGTPALPTTCTSSTTRLRILAQASTGNSEANFSPATEALFHRSELASCSFAGLLLLFIVGISIQVMGLFYDSIGASATQSPIRLFSWKCLIFSHLSLGDG